MRSLYLIGGVTAVLLGVLAFFTFFTVNETEHAIVTQFGDPIETISEPGSKVKLPWRDVRYY
ncbi:MAG: protease modulator HflC, partial [Kiloniellales bacterium]|nr:protease modulator HflC [Kiloniellales bacterium]